MAPTFAVATDAANECALDVGAGLAEASWRAWTVEQQSDYHGAAR